MKSLRTMAAVISVNLLSLPAHATLGIFEHGSGIKSLGFGGVSYVGIDETTALSANPALATGMGNRFDIGVDVLHVSGGAEIIGNAAGPDASFQFKSNYYPIPQIGYSTRFEERWTFGVTAFAAGLGPIYPQSPYARFAGPDDNGRSNSAQTSLKVAGVSFAFAYEAFPGHSFGIAANLVNQWLSVEGLLPFAPLSEDPDAFSNRGGHVSYGVGFTVGWTGRLTDWLDGGLSYRSEAQQLPIQEYGACCRTAAISNCRRSSAGRCWQSRPTTGRSPSNTSTTRSSARLASAMASTGSPHRAGRSAPRAGPASASTT